MISFLLADIRRETGLPLAALRAQTSGGSAEIMEALLRRAATRGEIGPQAVSPRVVRLPMDLVRLDSLLEQAPLSDAALEEIVDTVFFPLLPRRPSAV